jgi:hypothetical protein
VFHALAAAGIQNDQVNRSEAMPEHLADSPAADRAHEDTRESAARDAPLPAVFTVCSDLTLIARTEAGQHAFNMSTHQAHELGKQLIAAARRGPEKRLSPLSCVPHIRTLDVRPYRVIVSTTNPVPWIEMTVESVDGEKRLVSARKPLSDGLRISILEHSFDAIDLEGCPELELQWQHDPLKVIGCVRGMFLQNGRVTGVAFFDTAPFAQEIRARVDAGELAELSLAFKPMESRPLPDGASHITRWRPIELSICLPGGSGDPECRIVPLKDCYAPAAA